LRDIEGPAPAFVRAQCYGHDERARADVMVPSYLQILANRSTPLPANVPAALAELAHLEAVLTLPKPSVHVVSDVHGEDVKLRQVVNNASGSLRPLFERVLAGRLSSAELEQLLTLVYYPSETWTVMVADLATYARRALLHRVIASSALVLRRLARHYSIKYVARIVPAPFAAVFHELVFADELVRQPAFLDRLLEPFVRHERDGELVHAIAHVIRNLAVGELVVAGDLGDRGPRIDRVIDVIAQQPSVAITWGNHDASWMAACLGQPAAIATVVRLSLRYQRLAQLEDGYGISLASVARLADDVYADDPAACFEVKGDAGGAVLRLARMQKAIAILQFKLEGQTFERRPEWGLAHRALLRRIDAATGTIEIDGARHALRDTRFPTVDWRDPHALSAGEARCLAELTAAFVGSRRLRQQMAFVASRGRMVLRRDLCAIFHGCVPVDDHGAPLAFVVDGEPRRGKALFDAFERVVQRAFHAGLAAAELDRDLVFYLWTGPRSPCFGKDRMATFETYFVADPRTHQEIKNPYFQLIHEVAFCARMLEELGVDPVNGFLINGHVPVKLEAGETPIKKSGRAITIDGAFAAAYGDKGFSLVLDAQRIYLAQHHHFESVEAAVTRHADIVPTVSDVVTYERPRTVGDTETGDEIRAEIAVLEELVRAFEANMIREYAGT
jgi:fructose-1,6-bisphosphatase-3